MIITGKTMKIPRRTIVDYDSKTKGDIGTIVMTKMVILTTTTAILVVRVIADIKIMNVTVCM